MGARRAEVGRLPDRDVIKGNLQWMADLCKEGPSDIWMASTWGEQF